MKLKPVIAVCLGVMAIPGAWAAMDFPKYGFKIDALDAKPGAESTTQALMMFLPTVGGFAPNVNVMIQPFSGKIEDYIALSNGQFEQMKWKIIATEKRSASEWRCEYHGSFNGASLHWYARAVLSAGKVYLITATAGETAWDSLAETLKKTVGSFSVE